MNDFGIKVLQWFEENKRSLPWRNTDDPYKIWLSEIILQQTRVQQGLPYYLRFVEKYPGVSDLAMAPKDEVFKLWQGLGYYRRAENMLKAAKIIHEKFQGKFPDSFTELKRLPGVGDYTAAAIASMAYGEPVPVVDGNVYRVLSRIFGIKSEIGTTKAKKQFSVKMLDLMKGYAPGLFNEAVMEFGALQCVPGNPACNKCIYKEDCFAFKTNAVNNLPVVRPRTQKHKLYLFYLVLKKNESVYLRRRDDDKIWRGLYDFPALEFDHKPYENELKQSLNKFLTLHNADIKIPKRIFKHQLTHINIEAQFLEVEIDFTMNQFQNENIFLVSKNRLFNYAVPRLVEKYLQETKFL